MDFLYIYVINRSWPKTNLYEIFFEIGAPLPWLQPKYYLRQIINIFHYFTRKNYWILIENISVMKQSYLFLLIVLKNIYFWYFVKGTKKNMELWLWVVPLFYVGVFLSFLKVRKWYPYRILNNPYGKALI